MGPRTAAFLVTVGAALLFGLRLGERALWSEEIRWAQIPREMLRTADYLHPTINGHTYYDKPLGSYWLVLAASWLTGGVDEIAARLPSAFSGHLGVILTMAIGRRLFGARAAALAGLILATSFGYVFFSRTAAADAENVAGVLLSLWLYLRDRDQPGGPWLLLLWSAMALTSLTKGLLGFALPILVIVVDSAWEACAAADESLTARLRRMVSSQTWFFNRWTAIALPLGLAIYIAPFALSVRETGSLEGLRMVFRENLQRFFAPVNHRGPAYLYAYVIFGLAAPWCVFLPAALWHHHRSGTANAQDARARRFVSVFFWGLFLFFSASASRRSYYLLPMLPAVALLIGRVLSTSPAQLLPTTRRLFVLGWAILSFGAIVAGLALLPLDRLMPSPWNRLPPLPAPGWFLAVWLLALAACAIAMRRLRTSTAAASAGVIAVFASGYVFLVALPATEPLRTRKAFATEARQAIAGDWQHTTVCRAREVVYYLQAPEPLAECKDVGELGHAIVPAGLRFVILRQRDAGELRGEARRVAIEATFDWEPENQRGDKLVLVEIHRGDTRFAGGP